MKHILAAFLILLSFAAPIWAARDCDGVNDEIAFGSDASLDDFTLRTLCFWLRLDVGGGAILTKGVGTTELALAAAGEQIRYISDWSTSNSNWIGTTDIVDGTFRHICATYDNTLSTNDIVFYVNGAVDALTTDTNGSVTWVADAANELQACETNADGADMDGAIAHIVYDNALASAEQVNMLRWGWNYGGLNVYHPLETDKLTNEGTATANGTAGGTTVVSAAIPVERKYMGLMGVGR